MSNAVMPLSDYKNACDKIREKTDSTDIIKSGELANKVNEVYEKGIEKEWSTMWNGFQAGGSSQEYNYAFYGKRWNDSNFKPKYDFYNLHSALAMFSWSNITELNKPISFSTSPINLTSIFSQNSTIKKILLLTVNENVTYNSWFYNCKALESVTFAGTIANSLPIAESTLLNKESILSIFSCLSNSATSKTLTLSKTAVNNAFETESGLADGSTGEEWLNLVATKPNWTISLS